MIRFYCCQFKLLMSRLNDSGLLFNAPMINLIELTSSAEVLHLDLLHPILMLFTTLVHGILVSWLIVVTLHGTER